MSLRVRDDSAKHTDEYRVYMASAKWRALRVRLIDNAGHMCVRCFVEESSKFARGPLEIHHLTYQRLGKERDGDLECLCVGCHEIADAERVVQTARRREQSAYQTGLNTWATNKYGEDWDFRGDAESIQEEFDEWIQFRRDR